MLIRYISLGLSAIGLFLSLWIVIPAPTLFLLPLGIGAPEISPWLLGGNLLALVLALLNRQSQWVSYMAIAGSCLGLILSLLPLSQVPAINRQLADEMEAQLGANYLTQIPPQVQQRLRPHPFIWQDGFRGISLPPVRSQRGIEFAQPDGVSLKLNLYQPVKMEPSQSYPTIVLIYGGAWRVGTPDNNETFSRYMAGQGYVVVAIDYRHSPQYRFPAQLQDVQAALDYIQTQAGEWVIDTSRIALMGRSAGSQLAMLAAAQATPPIKAVVNYYGPVNLTSGYQNPPVPDPIGSRSVLEDFLGGPPAEFPDLYRQASPIHAVRPDFPPVLLVYAGRDNVVQSKFGRNLYQALQAAGNRAVFLEIPWADHVFDAVFNGISNQLALYYTERFLAWTLQLE